MPDCVEKHDGKVNIGSQLLPVCAWFPYDIHSRTEEEQQLEALVKNLDKDLSRCQIEISALKTKLMTNSANDIQRKIEVKGPNLGAVISFKYF